MKSGDVVIIISTVCFALLIAFLTTNQSYDSEFFSFSVKHDSELVLELTVDKDYKGIHEFEFEDHTGYVEIDGGKVRILQMTKKICPRQICSRLGWANRQGDILVCLPNKIVVEVMRKEGEGNYGADAISF